MEKEIRKHKTTRGHPHSQYASIYSGTADVLKAYRATAVHADIRGTGGTNLDQTQFPYRSFLMGIQLHQHLNQMHSSFYNLLEQTCFCAVEMNG